MELYLCIHPPSWYWMHDLVLYRSMHKLCCTSRVVRNKFYYTKVCFIYCSFVVHVLIALKYPTDSEKMDTAEKLTKRQQCKRYNKKDDFALPYEWLHPKNGRHIESIDCLLHHDDLIKGTNISSKSDRRKPIEGSLFEKNITQWEGTVTTVRSDYQGVITFKRRLPVRFVPINALPSMPSPGDTVKFCLSFDGFGLSAWRVIGEAGRLPSHLSDITSRDVDDSPSEYDEQEDMQEEDFVVAPSLSSIDIQEPDKKQTLNEYKSQQPQSEAVKKRRTKWDEYNEQRMHGIVSYSNHELGFGFIENADIEDKLFFHASQLRVPVTTFEGKIVEEILLDFKVEKLKNRIRAADIGVLKVCQTIANCQLGHSVVKRAPLFYAFYWLRTASSAFLLASKCS